MRKFILIAAIALTSTASYAGPSRSLSLASADPNQPTTEQQQKPQNPVVPQPAAANPAPQIQTKTPVTDERPASRQKRRPIPVEAQIIYELHRHGIYW
jgi:outer membrane biosynthesis protein TonB